MREPRVFLLAVAGFLVLAVLHFATVNDAGMSGGSDCSCPYSPWTCSGEDDSGIQGGLRKETPWEMPEAMSSGPGLGFFFAGRDDAKSGSDIPETDRDPSCIRCHAGGEHRDPLFREGE